jgi:hypothetical protein
LETVLSEAIALTWETQIAPAVDSSGCLSQEEAKIQALLPANPVTREAIDVLLGLLVCSSASAL